MSALVPSGVSDIETLRSLCADDPLDLYAILGVKKKASMDVIKLAFKKLAKVYHPDIHQINDGIFDKIRLAYETLYNPKTRSLYDEFDLIPGTDQDTELQIAVGKIGSLFMEIVSKIPPEFLHTVDIIGDLSDKVDELIYSIQENLKATMAHVEAFNKGKAIFERRMKRKKKALKSPYPDPFKKIIDANILRCNATLEQFKKDLAIHILMRDILEQFTYDYDANEETAAPQTRQPQMLRVQMPPGFAGFRF